MATRGPQNIFSGEILPVAPKISDPELDAFVRKLLDYLRRLTGKLARFSDGGGGSGTLKTLATTCLDQSLDPGQLDITWEASLWQDDIFSFSGPSTSITVLEAGYYVVEVDWRVFKNYPSHILSVYVNGATTTPKMSYLPNTLTSGETYSYMVPLVLAANDVITIHIESATGVGAFQGTRLLISKVGAPA